MRKEMARTCRAAHSALLRRVVGLRLQSSAVGWGCPSHWTRLPSLLSANMRLLSEIEYYTKPVKDVRSGLHNFTSRACFCACTRPRVRLFYSTSHSTATSATGYAKHDFTSSLRLEGPGSDRASSPHWAHVALPVRAQFNTLLCIRVMPGVVLGADSGR